MGEGILLQIPRLPGGNASANLSWPGSLPSENQHLRGPKDGWLWDVHVTQHLPPLAPTRPKFLPWDAFEINEEDLRRLFEAHILETKLAAFEAGATLRSEKEGGKVKVPSAQRQELLAMHLVGEMSYRKIVEAVWEKYEWDLEVSTVQFSVVKAAAEAAIPLPPRRGRARK